MGKYIGIAIVALIVGVFAGPLLFQQEDEQPIPPTEQLAPVPETAFGPPVPQDKGYLVEEISDGLYWVTEGMYQVMFLTTGEGVIVVDAPPTIGENISRIYSCCISTSSLVPRRPIWPETSVSKSNDNTSR